METAPRTLTTEAASAAPKVPDYMVGKMFSDQDNTDAFTAVMEQGIDSCLAELTAAYYSRPSYFNGLPAPATLPPSHPLREKIQSLDLERVTNPLERTVFGALRESWRQRAEGGAGDDENAIALLLLPGVIREHSAKTAQAVIDKAVLRMNPDPMGRSAIALRGVLDEAARKLADPQSADDLSMDLASFALSAASATDFAKDSGVSGVEPYGELFVKSACNEITQYSQTGPRAASPETIQNIHDLLASPIEDLRSNMREAFSSDPVYMYKLVAAMTSQPRLQRMLNNPSRALGEFITTLHDVRNSDPALFPEAASGLMSEYYAQASKAPPSSTHHYTARIRELAKNIASISANPEVEELFRRHIPKEPAPGKVEAHIIRVFRTLARFNVRNIEPFDSIDALEAQLIDGLHDRLTESKAPLEDGQRARVLERFGSVDPLLVYSLKFMGDETYRSQLAGLLQSVADNTYEAWHRGDGSSEALRRLIEAGHLPRNTAPEQYAEWCRDGAVSSREQLMSSSGDMADAIRSSVALGSVDMELLAPGYTIDKEGMAAAVASKNALGKLTGMINSQTQGQKEGGLSAEQVAAIRAGMGAYNELPGIQHLLSRMAAGEDVGSVRQEIEGTRAQLEQLRLLIRIAHITPEEVAAGALLTEPNKDGKRNIQRELHDALDYLSKELPLELRFIPESVNRLLASAATNEGGAETMTAEDTIDPKVTIEIGETPQRTCQHYENGIYNEGLLGYFGPEVKIGIVRNEKGNIVGRCIIRLTEDKDGNPVLFTEPVYQSIASPQVKMLLSEHVRKKAARMGVRVKGSLAEDDSREPEILRVRKLRMPTYSDSAATHLSLDELVIRA